MRGDENRMTRVTGRKVNISPFAFPMVLETTSAQEEMTIPFVLFFMVTPIVAFKKEAFINL